MNYYNDNDPKIAAWLRELIRAGLIPKGDVDERSILDVKPHELSNYIQHHFFAGIGGWSLALKLANWPEDKPVWTGSCPCQPLSCAGQRKGHADQRHLWPAFYALIAECRPATIFGEQVAGPDGREWLAGVRTDLEGSGYAVGSADLCAASVGAPHRRQRLYWVAHSNERGRRTRSRETKTSAQPGLSHRTGISVRLGDTNEQGSQGRGKHIGEHADQRPAWETSESCGMGDPNGAGWDTWKPADKTSRHGNTIKPRGIWDNFSIVHCLDGKTRRFEPGSFPLAHGVSNRVGLLRGYGNAIVPTCAAQFIMAAMESLEILRLNTARLTPSIPAALISGL